MSRRSVYLAGPILGCFKGEANDWRHYVSDRLMAHNIIGISPLRCEPLIGDFYGSPGDDYKDERFGTSRAITSKNMFDTKACDLVLAYLPTPPAGRHQSYGTIGEINWAFALGKPAIVVTDDPEISGHPVLAGVAGWLLDDLEEGIDVCVGLLAGYCGGRNV